MNPRFARNEDRSRALDAGYQLHLGKPVDREALAAAILSLLPVGSTLMFAAVPSVSSTTVTGE